ncbi:MAG: tetratricopeptide repeat protein [Rhizobiaceae bacterium]
MKFEFGPYRFDTQLREISKDGQILDVQPQVFELIAYLIENRDRVVSKDEVIEHVWQGRIISDGALNARINAARKALGDSGDAQLVIKTFPRRGFRFIAAIAAIAAASGGGGGDGGGGLAGNDDCSGKVGEVALGSEASSEERPTLAVLPFANLSGDPEQAYFSNGMAVDLAIDLSKYDGLKLLSRNITFAMDGSDGDPLQKLRSLGVTHLVEGSVRKMYNKIRVSVELIDAADGETLWAERYDGDFDEIFDFQDAIRSQIVAALNENLLGPSDGSEFGHRSTNSVEAYDLYMRGRERYFHYTPDGLKDAIDLLNAAIELDSEFSDAHAYLAYFYTAVRTLRFIEMVDPLGLAEKSALRAVELAPESALANTWLGWVYGLQGQHERAYEYFEKAIALDPELPEVFTYYGSICIYGGRPQEALKLSQRALELHSFAPPSWDFHVGQAHFLLRDYDKALQKFEQARARIPKFTSLRLHMAVAYWEAGQPDAARAEVEAVLAISPDYTLAMAGDNYPYVAGELRDRFLGGLKAAGIGN